MQASRQERVAGMMWSRTARLPLNGGGLALPPVPPYTAARNVRISAALLGLLGLAWLLAELPLLLSAAAIAAVTATLLLLRFPHLIWLGLAVALPFASGFKIGPISIADCILGAAVLLWFANGVRTNRLRLNTGLLPLLFIIYLLALLLSFRNAIDVREASEGVIKWLQMLIAILLIQEALTPRQVRWLVWGLLTGAMLQSALGLYQFVFRIGPPNFLLLGRFMRAAGTFGQPNPFAGYLGLTLPVAVALFMLNLTSFVKLSGTGLKQSLTGTVLYGGGGCYHRHGSAGQLEPGRLAGYRRQHDSCPTHLWRTVAQSSRPRWDGRPAAAWPRAGSLHSRLDHRSTFRPACIPGHGHVGK